MEVMSQRRERILQKEIETLMQAIVDLPIELLTKDHMASIAKSLDAEHATFLVLKYPKQEPNLANYGITTYSDEWFVRYVSQEYWRIDPVVQRSHVSDVPFDWKFLANEGKIEEFWKDAKEHGIRRSGLSIPVHTPNNAISLFCLANMSVQAVDHIMANDDMVLLLQKFASFLQDKALRKFQNDQSLPLGEELTHRELEVLRHASMGLQMKGIAAKMKRSPETIKTHLTTARQKLGALTTTHAVAIAARDELI